MPEPEHLLQLALNSKNGDRPASLLKLAESLTEANGFTIGSYAKQVGDAGLCTPTEFKAAVKSAARSMSSTPRPTDDELALIWQERHPLTAYGLGQWRRYCGGAWPTIAADRIRSEIKDVLEAAKPLGIRPTQRLLTSVLEFARISVAIDDERWDSDLDILVFHNGTLHIPTRVLRSHSPDDYVTSSLPYAYDPAAECPTFKRALQEAIPDAIELVQEFAGYAVTGDTSHEIALWFQGKRGSGKSARFTPEPKYLYN